MAERSDCGETKGAFSFGIVGAFLVSFGILMAIAYRHDKKKQREYSEDDA